MVREFPAGTGRDDGLWPMFWQSKIGSCPFIRPRPAPKRVEQGKGEEEKTGARTKEVGHVAMGENKQVVNREVPASGIVNSSTAFSAIRSTTTCGSKSNTITSALSGMSGAINTAGSLPRPLRELKTRLTSVIKPTQTQSQTQTQTQVQSQIQHAGTGVAGRMEPVAKKRKVETPLREQLQAKNRKKDKKEGYCENCKERFDDYDEVSHPPTPKILCWVLLTRGAYVVEKTCQVRAKRQEFRRVGCPAKAPGTAVAAGCVGEGIALLNFDFSLHRVSRFGGTDRCRY